MILTLCANPSVDSFWSINDIQQGTTNRSSKERFFAGGKGVHVAMALHELGQKVALQGVWGGVTGNWIKKSCEDKGIEISGPIVNGWTRICITNQSNNSWNETEFLGSGPSLTPEQIKEFYYTFEQSLKEQQPNGVVIAGSTPAGFEDSAYKKLISTAQKHNTPTYIDASGSLLKQSLDTKPHLIHINQHEGKTISGYLDPQKICQWLQQYCNIAAITAGSDGLYLSVDDQIYHGYHILKESAIHSTIGSGDCLLAGLCKAINESKDPKTWVRWGVACGSANCVYPKLGMLSEEDVSKFFNQVTVEKY
ncbi:1-phosphofructokinase family hexose kinase [Fodinibius sp. Rm-B-1B1-1]|uniref:1-phosphofructokinase family hexose kinase n=1 Tax=Fodinibius alkaliphilus TaxID=3140241 RepID=UPI00315A33CF